MTAGYQHSRVFAQLKSTEERIATNLTTSEYLQILDAFLMKAVRPLILHTNFVQDSIAGMAGWQEANRRRKISSGNHREFRNRALIWLMTYSATDRADSFANLRIDRGIVLAMCNRFIELTDSYAQACNATLKDADGVTLSFEKQLSYVKDVERALGAVGSMMTYRHDILVWTQEFLTYKEQVVEKYIRLALRTAQYDYVNWHNCSPSLDDVAQVYLMAAARAVDRCDFRLGVLTTQVQYAFLTARTSVQKTKSKLHAELDDNDLSMSVNSTEHDMDQVQRVEHLCRVASLVDLTGAARAFLGLTAQP